MAIGTALGILVGLLTGSSFLVLLRAANGTKLDGPASVITILVQMLIVPALWFGAPLLAVRLGQDPRALLEPYVVALSCAFALIAIVPMLAWLKRMPESWL